MHGDALNYREQFERQGYLVIRGAVPKHVISALLEFAGANIPQPEPPNGAFPIRHELLRACQPLIASLKGHGVLNQLLGSEELHMLWRLVLRFIRPNNEIGLVPPHQDAAYHKGLLTDFVTVWVPLVPIDEECGGVALYPEVSRRDLVGEPEQVGLWLDSIDVSAREPMTFDMEPGDILIFSEFMVHGSRPNTSDRLRFSVDMRFFGDRTKVGTHYIDLQTWKIVDPAVGN